MTYLLTLSRARSRGPALVSDNSAKLWRARPRGRRLRLADTTCRGGEVARVSARQVASHTRRRAKKRGGSGTRCEVIQPLGQHVGATVFIVFVLYDLETAQPKNIFFGHLISIIVGIIINETIGLSFYSLGLSVGVAVILMVYFKVMHPPAASNPLVALTMDLSFDFILFPVITGTIIIILMSVLINRIILKRNYPKKWF